MLGPILVGALAAGVVAVPHFVSRPRLGFVAIVAVTFIAALIQRWVISRRAGARYYDGATDFLVHIHSPAETDSSVRWFSRGVISGLLSWAGVPVGIEGAAAELAHGAELQVRPKSARWFEQRRRTDAAVAIAAAVSAAFGAPFAAILVPMEMGIGGRTWSVVLASLSAFVCLNLLPVQATLNIAGLFIDFDLTSPWGWLLILVLSVLAGVLGFALIRFLEFSKAGLNGTFPGKIWIRMLVGGVLLALLALAYRSGLGSLSMLFEGILWDRFSIPMALLLLASQLLGVALVTSSFGTAGLFWPLFLIGGIFGFIVHGAFVGAFSAIVTGGAGQELSVLAILAGGAALWATVIGAPLAGAVLAFEVSGNIAVLLPCLVVTLLARQVRTWLKSRTLFQDELDARGVSLVDGRSAAVLNSVMVRDAMVDDFETVHEQESVSDLYLRLVKSRYPFFPMVNAESTYLGMITADMIQDGWRAQDPLTSNSPLSKLLEAKDLLYRSGLKTTTVRPDTAIRDTIQMFEENPCVPVVNEKKQVVGLLFAYSVRLAYEREAARRSLALSASSRSDA